MSSDAKLSPVEYVFKHMAATYGAAWDRAMGQAPIADVMTVWEYQLQQFTQSSGAKKMIMWALDNLPERCPNVIEFKALCRAAPATTQAALPEPVADPNRVAAELAKMGHVRDRWAMLEASTGMKDWAHRLKARHDAGEKLNPNQIRCYQAALGATA